MYNRYNGEHMEMEFIFDNRKFLNSLDIQNRYIILYFSMLKFVMYDDLVQYKQKLSLKRDKN